MGINLCPNNAVLEMALEKTESKTRQSGRFGLTVSGHARQSMATQRGAGRGARTIASSGPRN